MQRRTASARGAHRRDRSVQRPARKCPGGPLTARRRDGLCITTRDRFLLGRRPAAPLYRLRFWLLPAAASDESRGQRFRLRSLRDWQGHVSRLRSAPEGSRLATDEAARRVERHPRVGREPYKDQPQKENRLSMPQIRGTNRRKTVQVIHNYRFRRGKYNPLFGISIIFPQRVCAPRSAETASS